MPATPIPPARCRRCTRRSSSRPSARRPVAAIVSSIAIFPAARRRQAVTMAPDADAGKPRRADPFQPLTSEQLAVGDGHEIYVESVGSFGGVPAVYLHGGPGSGCQPDHRRLFDPERFHTILFDQRGAGRSRPKGSREANTLPLAYAQAYPERVSGIAVRATFLGTQQEVETAFCETLPRFYPGLSEDFLGLLTEDERKQPLQSYWRRLLDSDPLLPGPAARAWHDTERILSEHTPSRTRLDPAALNSNGALPSTPF